MMITLYPSGYFARKKIQNYSLSALKVNLEIQLNDITVEFSFSSGGMF